MDGSNQQRPQIAVLMATYQGERFLREQVGSILGQRDVDVRLIVSDDGSTDGTLAVLQDLARNDSRITVLPPKRSGSSAGNFFRLIIDADVEGMDAIAFSDQDDIWEADKLTRHAALLHSEEDRPVGGVSSNVTPFDECGPGELLWRAGDQRIADYVFDSAGPGSTYLITPELHRLIRAELLDPDSSACQAPYHDWLIYALARAAGFRWIIDEQSTVNYRQHDANVLGAQSGFAQNLDRLKIIASGEHRAQTLTIAAAAVRVARGRERERLEWLIEQMRDTRPLARLRLLRRAGQYRRSLRDRVALAGTIGLGLW